MDGIDGFNEFETEDSYKNKTGQFIGQLKSNGWEILKEGENEFSASKDSQFIDFLQTTKENAEIVFSVLKDRGVDIIYEKTGIPKEVINEGLDKISDIYEKGQEIGEKLNKKFENSMNFEDNELFK